LPTRQEELADHEVQAIDEVLDEIGDLMNGITHSMLITAHRAGPNLCGANVRRVVHCRDECSGAAEEPS
jgi:hypothetical protein